MILRRRLAGLEETMQGTPEERQQMRERVLRIAERQGVSLPSAEVEALVSRHVGTPARIQQMRASGLTDDEIFTRLITM
jgi:hypothetical protein